MAAPKPLEDPPDRSKRQKPGTESESGFNVLLAALLPLLGGIVYVVLRGNYAWVYSRFGTTPEEVGVDPSIVLTGAARVLRLGNWRPKGGDFTYLLTRVVILLLVISVPFLLRLWAKRDLQSPSRGRKWIGTTSQINFVMVYVAILFLATILTFLFWLPKDGERAVERIGMGVRVRPGDFSFLSIQAYHADILWIGQQERPERLPNNSTLMYLGRTGGQVVVYDCKTRHTWRVPESSALIELEPRRVKLKHQWLCPRHSGGS